VHISPPGGSLNNGGYHQETAAVNDKQYRSRKRGTGPFSAFSFPGRHLMSLASDGFFMLTIHRRKAEITHFFPAGALYIYSTLFSDSTMLMFLILLRMTTFTVSENATVSAAANTKLENSTPLTNIALPTSIECITT